MKALPLYRPLPWQAIPFLRILPAFASGILSGSLWIGSSRILLVMIPLLFGCLLLLEKWHPISLLKKMGMQGTGMIILLYLAGSYIATKKYGSIHARAGLERHTISDAIIKEAPSGKKKWKATALQVVSQHCNGQTIPLNEVILAHIDSVNALRLEQGCRIRFRKKLTSMDRLANPGSFDWNRYWQQKNIYYQVYLSDADSIEILGMSTPIIQSILSECRKWVIIHLQKNIPDSITAGLAEALLIGFKEDLDRDLRRYYSDTGLMHVIAISGMHLGLIYAVLIALLRLLPFPGRMQTVKTVIALPVLWTFSFLTGAGPSIIRSAVMYSLMTFSIVLNKKNSAVNSLLGSAFLLLSVEPAWIYDVGFQLSYCAVLSILLFYQPIRRWHYARRRIWRLGWDLIAVTLSAQILTLPLCIYHFHQFPVYFLPANMVVVPLSSIVLMGELALCALFFSPLLSKVLGNVLHHIIKIMNGCVEAISGWPGAVWEPLHIDAWQTILLYLFVVGGSLTMAYRHKSGLIFAAMMLAFFLLIRWQSFHEAYKQHAILIYDAGKASAMDILQGRKSMSFTEADTSAEERIRMIRAKKHALSRVSNIQNIALNRDENMIIRWNKMNILILAGHGVTTNTLPLHSMDLLWVRENAALPEKETFYKWKVKTVILDGSNGTRQAVRWEEFCSALNTPSHRIVEKGPFVMKIAYPTFAPSEKKFCTLFH